MAPSTRISRVLALVALAQAVGVAPAQVGYFYDPYIQNVPHPNGVNFGGAVLADFNSDGFIDVVMGATDHHVYRSFGGPNGSFGTVAAYGGSASNDFRCPVKTVHANGDAALDILTWSYQPMFQILFGNGAGGFTVGPYTNTGQDLWISSATQVDADDLDGDGGLDIACAGRLAFGQTHSQVRVYSTYNNGAAIGTSPYTLDFPTSVVEQVAIADVDADGLKDVVFAEQNPCRIWVLRRMPGSAFTQLGPFFLPSPAPATLAPELVAHDLNGDGYQDVVAVGSTGPGLSFLATLLGGPGASLIPGTAYATSTGFLLGWRTRSVVADFDLDGSLDVMGRDAIRRIEPAFAGASTISVYPAYVYNSFSTHVAADMDSDGDVDCVAVYGFAQLLIGVAANGASWGWGCNGSSPPIDFTVGRPAPGNPGCLFAISQAPALATAVLAVSPNSGAYWSGCDFWLDVSSLLLPAGTAGFTTTSAAGTAGFFIPLPDVPALLNQDFFAQWLVAKPGGAFTVGPQTYVLSNSRRILIW